MTGRHLTLIRPGEAPPAAAPGLRVSSPGHSSGRARLSAWQRMEVEGVRELLRTRLPALSDGDLTGPRAAYLAGLLEGAAASLLEVIDALTEPGD